jgi:hypothetical protein
LINLAAVAQGVAMIDLLVCIDIFHGEKF